MLEDVVAGASEDVDGRPLLVPVMRGGERLTGETLETMRARAQAEMESLAPPLRVLDLDTVSSPYRVETRPTGMDE